MKLMSRKQRVFLWGGYEQARGGGGRRERVMENMKGKKRDGKREKGIYYEFIKQFCCVLCLLFSCICFNWRFFSFAFFPLFFSFPSFFSLFFLKIYFL